MAYPIFVSVSSQTQGASTFLTINAPAMIAKGNLLVAVVNPGVGTALVAPSGWITGVAAGVRCTIFYRIATDVEPATYTWTWTGSTAACALIQQWSGVIESGFDVVPVGGTQFSTSILAPTIQPKWNADVLVNVYVAGTASAITVPASQTGHDVGFTSGNGLAIVAGWENLSSNTATGTRTATTGGAGTNQFGFSMVLREPQTQGFVVDASLFAADPVHRAATLSPYGRGNIVMGHAAVVGLWRVQDRGLHPARRYVGATRASRIVVRREHGVFADATNGPDNRVLSVRPSGGGQVRRARCRRRERGGQPRTARLDDCGSDVTPHGLYTAERRRRDPAVQRGV
jgi:hypothetical protein